MVLDTFSYVCVWFLGSRVRRLIVAVQAEWPQCLWRLSFLTRDQTCIPCIAKWILNRWTTREVPQRHLFGGSLFSSYHFTLFRFYRPWMRRQVFWYLFGGILWNSAWASVVVEPSTSVALMIFNLINCALEKERCLQLASSFSFLSLYLPSALLFSGSVVMNGMNFGAGKTGVWFHTLTHPSGWPLTSYAVSLSLGHVTKHLVQAWHI